MLDLSESYCRAAQSTHTLKADYAIIQQCIELQDDYIEFLKKSIGADNFVTMFFFQPIQSYLGQIAKQSDRNMLGLDRLEYNAVMWTGGVATNSEASFAIAQTRLNALSYRIRNVAESMHGKADLIYLNYADPSQNSLGSYGIDNVNFMRDVAAKYDPDGVFQTRIPGGFKLSKVV
jgi:hypothetical protein